MSRANKKPDQESSAASPSIYVLYGERKTTTADEETDANPAIVIMEDTTSRFFSVFPLWFPFKVPPIDILVLVVYGFEGHCTPPKRASAGADHANCASPATGFEFSSKKEFTCVWPGLSACAYGRRHAAPFTLPVPV